ncbi:MAG TPA: Uma2 family endonuclease [Vicinamibacterales bacterium]|nr:Uma2 family endonuclease [Vicinamibacterales bacterium]
MKLTYDDFVHFPDDGNRHELIDGEHYVTPSPSRRHQAIVRELLGQIWSYLKQHPVGEVFGAPFDVVFSDFDVVEPDLLFVSRERAGVITEKNVQGAPDLVVEVGSPATRRRDEKAKLQLYERFGVREYWVVDPDLDLIKVYRTVEGRYERAAELTIGAGEALSTPLMPGLTITLADIFPST